METKPFEISWMTLWRILLFVIFVSILITGKQILLGLFLAIIISSGLDSLVDFLERYGIPRTLGVVLIFLIGVFAFTILVYAVLPLVIADVNELLSGLGNEGGVGSLISFKNLKSLDVVVNRFSSQFFSESASPIEFISKALGGLGLAVAVLVSSFYLSVSRGGVEKFLRFVAPADYEKMTLAVYERSRKKMSSWFRTQIALSCIMAVMVWIVLFMLHVKHAFILGVFAGIFELMPFVGPILAGAVSVLVALSTSPWLAFWTLIAFLVLHQFEAHVLVPLLTKRSVNLHPVIVIIALLIGVEAGGFLGILISVPAAAVFHEILNEWSSKKRLNTELV